MEFYIITGSEYYYKPSLQIGKWAKREDVEKLLEENKKLKEMIYAIGEAKSVSVMQASANLFKKWLEENPEKEEEK